VGDDQGDIGDDMWKEVMELADRSTLLEVYGWLTRRGFTLPWFGVAHRAAYEGVRAFMDDDYESAGSWMVIAEEIAGLCGATLHGLWFRECGMVAIRAEGDRQARIKTETRLRHLLGDVGYEELRSMLQQGRAAESGPKGA
jgi:hypothetical protein